MKSASVVAQAVPAASGPSTTIPGARKHRADPHPPRATRAVRPEKRLRPGTGMDPPEPTAFETRGGTDYDETDTEDATASLPAEMMLAVLTALVSDEGAHRAVASRPVCRRWDGLLSLVPAVRSARRAACLRMYARVAFHLLSAASLSGNGIFEDTCCLVLVPSVAGKRCAIMPTSGTKKIVSVTEYKPQLYMWHKQQPKASTCRCGEAARLAVCSEVGRDFGRLFLACKRPGTFASPNCGYKWWVDRGDLRGIRGESELTDFARAVSYLARRLERRPDWAVELCPGNRWSTVAALNEMLGCAAGKPLLALLGPPRFREIRHVGLGAWLVTARPSLSLSAPCDWIRALDDRSVFVAVGAAIRRLDPREGLPSHRVL